MGLIRYARPASQTSSGSEDWTPSSGTLAAAWDLLDDEFRTYTVRTSSGGVETDPASDSSYLQFDASGGAGKHTFGFAPIGGDDSIARLLFHVRAWISTGAVAPNLTIGRRVGTTDTDIGTVAISGGSTPTNYTLTATADGSGAAWTTDDLSADLEFYLSAPSDAYTIRVSRFHVEARFVAGITLGRWKAEEHWRYCDVCGTKGIYARMIRPVSPHPQAGLVVHERCYDEPDHETRKIMNARHPKPEVPEVLY